MISWEKVCLDLVNSFELGKGSVVFRDQGRKNGEDWPLVDVGVSVNDDMLCSLRERLCD